MSILPLAAAAAALLATQTPAPQDTQILASQPMAGAVASQLAPAQPLTPAQQRIAARAQAQRICSRRAPTGSRLDQTTCVTRETATAMARSGQDELDKMTVQTGWQIERGD